MAALNQQTSFLVAAGRDVGVLPEGRRRQSDHAQSDLHGDVSVHAITNIVAMIVLWFVPWLAMAGEPGLRRELPLDPRQVREEAGRRTRAMPCAADAR